MLLTAEREEILLIETLFYHRKYGRNLNGPYGDEQIAIATSVRIMLEEHLFWYAPRLFHCQPNSCLSAIFERYLQFAGEWL